MRQKIDKSRRQKATKRKTGKTEPVPPLEEDKGHGEEIAPAKQKQTR
jgi:hypothetical protein